MPTNTSIASEALALLSRQLGGEPDTEESLSTPLSLEDLRQFVMQHVSRLLRDNPALLMSILYRIDVAERDVQSVLAFTQPSEIAAELADLLIARQVQKIKIRRAYRDGGATDAGTEE